VSSTPAAAACSTARRGTDPGMRLALTRTLVSTTTRDARLIENGLQFGFSESARRRTCPDLVEYLGERPLRLGQDFEDLAEPDAEKGFRLQPLLPRQRLERAGRLGVHGYDDRHEVGFHNGTIA